MRKFNIGDEVTVVFLSDVFEDQSLLKEIGFLLYSSGIIIGYALEKGYVVNIDNEGWRFTENELMLKKDFDKCNRKVLKLLYER